MDYQVDYHLENFKSKPSIESTEEPIHTDHIGEYKSVYMKIQFDKTSA